MKPKVDILVVGGGMYVCGRGTENYGTIVPALLEARRAGSIGRLGIVTTNVLSAGQAAHRTAEVAQKMGVDGQCAWFPTRQNNTEAYLEAVKQFQPDAVIVSVPDHLHAAVVIPLIKQGLHCLVVKPLAPTVKEAQAMTAAAEQAGVIAQVEFHKRLDESNLLLYDAIRAGKLGKLLYAVIEYSQKKKIPRDIFRSWSAQSSIFQYLGVHYVDLLQFVTAFQPWKVSAWGQKDYLLEQGIDTWDAMQVVVEWKRDDGGNFVSTHMTNWIDPDETSAMSDQKINIVGTQGRYQADQKHRGIQMVVDGQGIQDLNPYFSTAWQSPNTGFLEFNGYGIKSILQFIHDVQGFKNQELNLDHLKKVRPSFHVCTVSTAVIEAAHLSLAQQGIPVEIKL